MVYGLDLHISILFFGIIHFSLVYTVYHKDMKIYGK